MSIYKNNCYIVNYGNGDSSLERNTPTIIKSSNDISHTVLDGETLHSIAYQYWKDSSKWYIIAEANQIMNPFTEVKPGMKLIIPAYGIQD